MGSRPNCLPGQQLLNKIQRRGLKHVRINELRGKTADPGDRCPDIVASNKNARTGKIDGPDYEVTYRLSALWFPGYEAVKELKESQNLVSESQRSRKTTGQKWWGEALSLRNLTEILGIHNLNTGIPGWRVTSVASEDGGSRKIRQNEHSGPTGQNRDK